MKSDVLEFFRFLSLCAQASAVEALTDETAHISSSAILGESAFQAWIPSIDFDTQWEKYAALEFELVQNYITINFKAKQTALQQFADSPVITAPTAVNPSYSPIVFYLHSLLLIPRPTYKSHTPGSLPQNT
ncbi:hypothetical protein FRC20_002037 [Serendipita sp. 405]|nr:hypothetical protein FRC20_002037 [Serendipita sp. 405]